MNTVINDEALRRIQRDLDLAEERLTEIDRKLGGHAQPAEINLMPPLRRRHTSLTGRIVLHRMTGLAYSKILSASVTKSFGRYGC